MASEAGPARSRPSRACSSGREAGWYARPSSLQEGEDSESDLFSVLSSSPPTPQRRTRKGRREAELNEDEFLEATPQQEKAKPSASLLGEEAVHKRSATRTSDSKESKLHSNLLTSLSDRPTSSGAATTLSTYDEDQFAALVEEKLAERSKLLEKEQSELSRLFEEDMVERRKLFEERLSEERLAEHSKSLQITSSAMNNELKLELCDIFKRCSPKITPASDEEYAELAEILKRRTTRYVGEYMMNAVSAEIDQSIEEWRGKLKACGRPGRDGEEELILRERRDAAKGVSETTLPSIVVDKNAATVSAEDVEDATEEQTEMYGKEISGEDCEGSIQLDAGQEVDVQDTPMMGSQSPSRIQSSPPPSECPTPSVTQLAGCEETTVLFQYPLEAPGRRAVKDAIEFTEHDLAQLEDGLHCE
ncbi:hypothetical protein CBS101457_005569 [Exobasidium rhododendri]|nr:hypothetical protein CBS101457_005569 [Exobasidium rhododendri]